MPQCSCPGVPFLDAFHLVKEVCPHTVESSRPHTDRGRRGCRGLGLDPPSLGDSGQATALRRASGSNLSDGEKTLSSQDSGEESAIQSLRCEAPRGARHKAPLNGAASDSGVPDVPGVRCTPVGRTQFSR